MKGLPGVWRPHRPLFLIGWSMFAAVAGSVIVATGGPGAFRVWGFPVAVLFAAAAVLTLGFVVSALRLRRALGVVIEVVGRPPDATRSDTWDLAVRWEGLEADVRATSGFFAVWNIRLRVAGEAWTFDARRAAVVGRYVLARAAPGAPPTADVKANLPWGLAAALPWATPAFFAAMVAGVVFQVFRASAATAGVWGGATLLLGTALLLWGRVRARAALGSLVDGLRRAGLRVDGPHLVEAGPALRVVLFSDRGPLAVMVVPVGPLVRAVVHRDGTVERLAPADLARYGERLAAATAASQGPAT